MPRRVRAAGAAETPTAGTLGPAEGCRAVPLALALPLGGGLGLGLALGLGLGL
ncbi:hypothetical protein ACGFX2_05430 [Streptomyces goshikiensis]|uniref:hypothetical protein n=1 Tax=Streptomyces goshikiensis TaxID=1942 RepID=UPI0037128E1D